MHDDYIETADYIVTDSFKRFSGFQIIFINKRVNEYQIINEASTDNHS
jgi:hypothetical protein